MEIYTIEQTDIEAIRKKLDEIRHAMIEKIEDLFDVTINDRTERLDWKRMGIDTLKLNEYRKNSNQARNSIQNFKSVRFSVESSATINSETADDQDREAFEGFALLITGQALVHCLTDELQLKFLELGTMCKTVICCRVTPIQKAQVVELVMKHEKQITLAIGDGANDVSMIQSLCCDK